MNVNKYLFRLVFYKTIEFLPDIISDKIYLFFQKYLGQLDIYKYLDSAEMFIQNFDRPKRNTLYLEIGTGWYPIVPLKILKKFAYPKSIENILVFSYDNRKLMSSKNEKDAFDVLQLQKAEFFNKFCYLPNVDLSVHDFSELKSIDFNDVVIFSKATLQHIKPELIIKIHKNLIVRFPNHKIIHLINCNDHRQHTDKSISKYDFLKYNEQTWLRKITRFDYHNRLRIIEYQNIFELLGYKITLMKYESPSAKDITDFELNILPHLDERFIKFSNEFNSAGTLIFKLEHHR